MRYFQQMKPVIIIGTVYKDREVAVRLKLVRCEEAADAAADDDDVGVEGGRWGRGSG
jgi:hypothetical protein